MKRLALYGMFLSCLLPCLNDSALADGPEATGPDVIVGGLYDLRRWGANPSGTIQAYSLGTMSCNIGDTPLLWQGSTNLKPVIGMNMFRLKDGRFEQIGQSWLKWAFTALAQNWCGTCINPGTGSLLGVNCSDPYSASLNGSQSRLGPKSVVNAFTAVFPASHATPGSGTVDGRLQVLTTDMDPNQNVGALYFVEGQYVTQDDMNAGNGYNNAAWRQVWVQSTLGISFTSPTGLVDYTHREEPAILAWRAMDPVVPISVIQIPDEGRLYLAWRAYRVGATTWDYEFALYNYNSHRSVGAFRIPLVTDPGNILSVGFHDVFYHSGEPYDGTDWPGTYNGTELAWATTPFATNQNANALRWGTLYNFRFRAKDVPPEQLVSVTLDLFRPGTPASISVPLPAQNSGDACIRALPITGGSHQFEIYTASTDGPAEAACGAFDGINDNDIWYRYTPLCTGTATISTCDSSFDTTLAVYAGGCPEAPGTAIACNNDACGQQAQLTVPVQAGVPVLIRVGGLAGAVGIGRLTVNCAESGAVNYDECSGAIDVYTGFTIFDNIGATTSAPNESLCSSFASGSHADVWFRYQATCTGNLKVRTCGSQSSGFDTKILVYAGGCPSAPGQFVACSNNARCSPQDDVEFAATRDTVYYIRIGGVSGSTGYGLLTIECRGGPGGGCPNDDASRATNIQSLPYTYSGTTLYCQNDYDEVCPYANSNSPDAVFEYTPASDQSIDISLCSSGFDTKLYVYAGGVTAGSPLACNDDGCGGSAPEAFRSRLSGVPVQGGVTYYIVVDGWNGAAGAYTIDVTETPSFPVGDMDCDGDVDFDDIDPFVLALSGQAAYLAQYPDCVWQNADVSGDGNVDFDDIDAFVALFGR